MSLKGTLQLFVAVKKVFNNGWSAILGVIPHNLLIIFTLGEGIGSIVPVGFMPPAGVGYKENFVLSLLWGIGYT